MEVISADIVGGWALLLKTPIFLKSGELCCDSGFCENAESGCCGSGVS